MTTRRALLLGFLASTIASTFSPAPALAEPLKLAESPTDLRVFSVSMQVSSQGKLVTASGPGKTQDLKLDSKGAFAFKERRLPAAGRDAKALRAVRDFQTAEMTMQIDADRKAVALPPDARIIVANGDRDGVVNYATRTHLTREEVDLLDMPGEPLALLAMLPDVGIEPGAQWIIAEWTAQMLTGIEAVEAANLVGKLVSVANDEAVLQIDGAVSGLAEGAKTSVTITGTLTCNVSQKYLARGDLSFAIKSDIGSVSPGMDATVKVKLTRQPTQEPGRLSDNLVSVIPIDVPHEAVKLEFEANPWGARLLHGRDWYVFQAILDKPPKVAILRLVERGSLICQCNISPIPDAAPGSHTPIDQFEKDIRTVLGDTFRAFKSKQTYQLSDGRTVLEVLVQGEVIVEGASRTNVMPMEWHYYLCTEPGGRQMSFVFAVEPQLAAQLGARGKDLVTSLQFRPLQAATNEK